MLHLVKFENCENKWDNALPLGNGVFGGMVFYQDNSLIMPLNHYEVYYNISNEVLPEDKLKHYKPYANPGARHEEVKKRADGNQPKAGEPFCAYQASRDGALSHLPYATGPFSGSHPATGELRFAFDSSMLGAESSLSLYIEEARVRLKLGKGNHSLQLDIITARCDCVVAKISQNRSGILKTLSMEYPPYRDSDYPDISYTEINESTFAYTVSACLNGSDPETGSPFVFAGVVKLVGAKGCLSQGEFGAGISISESENEFHVLAGIFTDWNYKAPLKDGIAKMNEYAGNIEGMYREHGLYWDEFFSRAGISIPDKFLERIYYINQYALDCCSGRGGVMKHHACGLNGLWDIRHPNLWGSMWYWDVNIQAAFAGVFSSNRLELGRVFSDGLLSYVGLAEKSARDVHNLDGCATDYPYSFYYSCWAWCAQYLWALYEYSLDEEYLRSEAYPLFLKLCKFAAGILEYDEDRDEYVVYPDISPEQGPLAHNSVITVSCIKYLFWFTLKAAGILGDKSEVLDEYVRILGKMPKYAVGDGGIYGRHFVDSEDAPENMWIRHPSMLMPVFPIGEYDTASDEDTRLTVLNTIRYLYEKCEIGIFGGSWLAAAAARMGHGQMALRILYERGIDHMLRSNGLAAEETERFMNYCLIMRQPLYYPCMMEFTGEMIAAVNEMLMQSQNGIIRVFPAVPNGDPEMERMVMGGYSITEYPDRYAEYDAWHDIRIDNMLARGAFAVSARLENDRLKWIRIDSHRGGMVRVTSPFMHGGLKVYHEKTAVEFEFDGSVISFDTKAGQKYMIAEDADEPDEKGEAGTYDDSVIFHETYTKRRIFIGENRDTGFYKSIDGFIRDWYLGNVRMENHTVYKFDFGSVKNKDYAQVFPRQAFAAEARVLKALPFIHVHDLQYTYKQGYGFGDASLVSDNDRGVPDELRRDFVEGGAEAEFIIEAPRGQYELLVVSGDEKEDSVTVLDAVNGRHTGGEVIRAGHYQCKLIPVLQEKDTPIRLRISTSEGYKWKVNLIFLNIHKGY